MKLKFLWVVIVSGNLFFLAHTTAAAPVMAFTANTSAVGAGPMSVAVGDFNGDGKIDLVTANYDNGAGRTLTVLTNNGTGGFGSNATFTVGTPFPFVPPEGFYQAPWSVTVADVNQDGKPDLVSANYTSGAGNRLTVMTNNGAGIFSSNAILTVGSGPKCVAAGDVNGDGKIDLISANYSAGTLTILTNAGNGTFGFNATLQTVKNSGFVVAADLNNDGKLDLFSVSEDSATSMPTISKLVIFTNSGSGIFGSNATLNLPGVSRQAAAVDVNGDGKMDIVAYAALNGVASLVVFTNNGIGNFSLSAGFPLTRDMSFSLTTADVNGDGKIDFISANADYRMTILINDGSGNFSLFSLPQVGKKPYSTAAADVNGDGKMDFITANNFDNTVTVLTQTNAALPALNIAVRTNMVSVSWQSPVTGFILQTNSDLNTTNWSVAPYLTSYAVFTSNGVSQGFVATSLPPDKLFFRFKP